MRCGVARDDRAVAKKHGEDSDVLHRKAQIAILSGLVGGNDDAHARRLVAQLERLGHTVVLDPAA